jgi:hypothetical protein
MKPKVVLQELLRILYISHKIDLKTYAEMWRDLEND